MLQRIVVPLCCQGLKPVTAFELEFYLVDPAVFQRSGRMGKDKGAGAGPAADVFALSELRGQSELFAEIRAAAVAQGLPIDTIIKEAAPGQFEVNLKHRADAMAAADDTVLLRRLITGSAHKHGLRATFMAKPFPRVAPATACMSTPVFLMGTETTFLPARLETCDFSMRLRVFWQPSRIRCCSTSWVSTAIAGCSRAPMLRRG